MLWYNARSIQHTQTNKLNYNYNYRIFHPYEVHTMYSNFNIFLNAITIQRNSSPTTSTPSLPTSSWYSSTSLSRYTKKAEYKQQMRQRKVYDLCKIANTETKMDVKKTTKASFIRETFASYNESSIK